MKTTMLRLCAVAAFLAVMALSATAQAPGAPSAAPVQTDLGKVEIKTTKVSNNFYAIEGMNCPRVSSCATIGALVGPDGVLLVDSGSVPEIIGMTVAALRQITDKPIRFMINTHVHGDHVAGNESLGKMGVLIFAREELRRALANPAPAANGTPTPPAPLAALPVVTYQGRMTFHMNGEDVEAIPVPVAHTDGDTMVRFPVADVIMTGDFFRNIGYPDMNLASGGSLKGMLDGLGMLIGLTGPNTKIVPGHGVITDRARVIAFRDILLVLRDRVASLIQQGKTVEEVVATHPNADYDGRLVLSQRGAGGSEATLRQLYAQLKGAK